MIRKGVSYTRGLAIVLLAITISASQEIKVQAMTVDDLRSYLGMTVAERQPTMIKVDDYESGQSNGSSPAGKKNGEAITLEQLKSELYRMETSYEQGLKANTSARDLVEMLSAIKDIKSEIDEKTKVAGTVNNVDVNALIASSNTENIEAEKNGKIGTYEFNIGDTGDKAISPTGKLLSLIKPYGYKINEDGSHEAKNTSIDLSAPVGTAIESQWNGKVAYIEDDESEGCKVITLFHGQGLYTVYHHVIPSDLYVGKTVYQGTTIGNSGDTSKKETDIQNHIEYQVILDGKYINPILVFGNRSRDMYEDWLKHSYDVYTVEDGEEFYYNTSMSKNNINKKTPSRNTIEGAAEVVGDYKLPDPGVVK